MAARKPLFMDTEGFSEEMAITDSMTLGGLTMGGAIAMGDNKITGLGDATADGDAIGYQQTGAELGDLAITSGGDITLSGGGELTGLPATPTGDTAATSKAYVDGLVISGGSFKEALLHEGQVDNSEGILGSIALVMQANPVSGDVITLTDGTTTRGYGAGSGGDVQYTIGATAADSMANLAAAIEGDGSAAWGGSFTTDLDAIDSAGVVVITEDDNDGTASKAWGVWATPANVQVVDFGGESDYTKKTLTNLPGSLPGSTNFGLNRTQSALTDGELHYVLNDDVVYGWDDSGNTWQTMSGSASIPDATSASGGGTKGKVTFDSDKGLVVVGGVAEVNIDAVTLDFDGATKKIEVTGVPSLFEIGGTPVGATVTAANLDDVTDGSNADSLHVHTGTGITMDHADLNNVTTDQHHAQSHTVASHSDTTATGAELETLTDGSNADALHVHASATATEAPKVENTLTTATDATSNGDPVYVNGNSTVGKSLANDDAKSRVLGVIRTGAGAAGATPEVVSLGICAGILSSATAGTPYYLQTAGGIGTSLPGGGNRVIQVGWAYNADDLWIELKDYGKKAA